VRPSDTSPEIAPYDPPARETCSAFGRYQGLNGEELKSAISRSWRGRLERAGERSDRLGRDARRLNIAAWTTHRPRVLLPDEPTVGVDPQSRNASTR
jgi:ABC-2 type transport system ATP-binding protein